MNEPEKKIHFQESSTGLNQQFYVISLKYKPTRLFIKLYFQNKRKSILAFVLSPKLIGIKKF